MPHLQREAHLAREAGIGLRSVIEGGVRKAGGGRREPDVAGGAERGEKGLFGGVGEPAGWHAAELEAAPDVACGLSF